MTNKQMLSVQRELLESCWSALMQKGQVIKALELRALIDKPEYPRINIVKAHTHTCACVVGDSGVCDCGAVIDGVGVEVKPAAQHQGEPVRWERMSKMDGGTWWPCANKGEADDAVKCGWKVRPLFAEQPAPVAVALPFAEKVIAKLQRFEACASDGQDVDIGRHWFDLLTQLELLRRVQRSPAYWEMTQQGEDALKATRLNSPQ